MQSLFSCQFQFLKSSCSHGLPSAGTGPSQAETIRNIQKFTDANVSVKGKNPNSLILVEQVKSSYINHLRLVSTSIAAMGWVVIQKNPAEVRLWDVKNPNLLKN